MQELAAHGLLKEHKEASAFEDGKRELVSGSIQPLDVAEQVKRSVSIRSSILRFDSVSERVASILCLCYPQNLGQSEHGDEGVDDGDHLKREEAQHGIGYEPNRTGCHRPHC